MTAHLATLAGNLATRIVDGYRRWTLRRRTTEQLYRLDNHMLRDIGVTRGNIPLLAARQAADTVARKRAERDRQRAGQGHLPRVPRLTMRQVAEDIAFRSGPCTAC